VTLVDWCFSGPWPPSGLKIQTCPEKKIQPKDAKNSHGLRDLGRASNQSETKTLIQIQTKSHL